MYNGIGLQTPRGSGTNGFVTRNLAFIRKHKDKVDYKSEEEIAKLEASLNKQPNVDILNHERKRKVELKCMEMQELMEEQGYSAEEIEQKVTIFRKMLMEKEGVTDKPVIETDELGRPIAKDTHALAAANQAKNLQLKAAFGLSEHYVDGSSFDPNKKAKQEAARALAMAQEQYSIVQESSPSEHSSPERRKKKKKKNRSDSESPVHEKKKKSKKSKRITSEESPEKKKSKKKRRKKSPKRKHEVSESSEEITPSDSEVDSDRSAPTEQNGHSKSPPVRSRSRSLSYSPVHRRHSCERSHDKPRRKNSRSRSQSRTPQKRRNKHRRSRSRSRSREHHRRHSRSRSRSPTPRRESRSPSIRRRRGSPSHLDKRRITRSTSRDHRCSYSRSRSPSYSRTHRSRSPRHHRRGRMSSSRSPSPHRRRRSHDRK